jgi:acyl-CoA reductase-like NAD-dependent aldehyde dehydrogenase
MCWPYPVARARYRDQRRRGASPHFAARYGFRYAVDASAFGAFLHQGQICMSARRLLVDRRVGRCFQATLLADVPADSELARLETFGPVATVEVVDGADAAVARANDTAYGLAAGILTGDPDRGLALADRLQAGIVHVNDQPVSDEPQMPYGGQAAIDEFTELKWVTVQSGTRLFPF